MQLYMKNLLKWTRLKMTTILNVFEEYFAANPKRTVVEAQPAFARASDPDTSHEAAETVDTTRLEALVYEVICKHKNGCISDDVERELAYLRSHSITPRFAPLIRKGFIVDTGERRIAASGRSQRVVQKAS